MSDIVRLQRIGRTLHIVLTVVSIAALHLLLPASVDLGLLGSAVAAVALLVIWNVVLHLLGFHTLSKDSGEEPPA